MATATLILEEDYLATSYRPDRREWNIRAIPASPIQIPLKVLFADRD